jgi:hypothetical protein
MKEPVHPGFTLLPAMDQRFKDGIAYGTAAENARIIKLLDGLIDKRTTYEMPMEYWVQKKLLEYVIALIKGEN